MPHFENNLLFFPRSSGAKTWQWLKNIFAKTSPFIPGNHSGKKKILIISEWVPEKDKRSSDLRMFHIIMILMELGYEVSLLPADGRASVPYTEEFEHSGVQVLDGMPSVKNYFGRCAGNFDLVIISRPHISDKYLPMARKYAKKSKLIYDTVDLHYKRFLRQYEIEGGREHLRDAARYKKIELSSTRKSDITFTITEDEKNALLKEVPSARIEVVPNIHKVCPTNSPFGSRRDIMFIGSFWHRPNVDAMQYFMRDIFPLIKEGIPEVKFYIVGSYPAAEIVKMQSEDVFVTGYVPDVSPFFETSRLLVCPLRFGAGMKGKLTQSMSYGLPFVSTGSGVEGMGLTNNYHCLVNDNPGEFAASVIKLYGEEELWESLRKNSLDFITLNYSFEIVKAKIARIVTSLVTT